MSKVVGEAAAGADCGRLLDAVERHRNALADRGLEPLASVPEMVTLGVP